ncbi:MAG: universal stress protein [Bilophila wadsworthia]
MEVKKILCAVDLEDTIAPSVEYAKMMASMTGASILVAYVIPAHTPYEDVYLSVNNQPNEVNNPNETIQKSMNALLAEQFAGMDATGVILVGRPSEELVKLAEEKGANLIVMGTHGRAGFDRLLFGSVAHEVVRQRHARMTVRPLMPKKCDKGALPIGEGRLRSEPIRSIVLEGGASRRLAWALPERRAFSCCFSLRFSAN